MTIISVIFFCMDGIELGLVMYDHTHCTSMIKLWFIITVIFKQEIIFKKLEQVKAIKVTQIT